MKNIKMIVLDVDGTLTNSEIAYMEDGQDWKEIKIFHAKDGLAMKTALHHGLELAIITGRESIITQKRADELGIKYCYQNIHHKVPVLKEICQLTGFSPKDTAYIGDDINDYGVMKMAGFSACPADAASDILSHVDYVASKDGGKGAVREVIELIMKEQDIWPVKNN